MKFDYELVQVHPSIFVLKVDNPYDLGMIFLRAQEFYESANKAFCGKEFTVLEYMDWFAKAYSTEHTFSYGVDFFGYNIPSEMIEECYVVNQERTPYDKFLLDIHQTIIDSGTYRYYLLGVLIDDEDNAFDHELAHAFFTLDEKYRETMTALVALLPFRQEMFSFLENVFEYGEHVHVDEAQAYMATGLVEEFGDLRTEYEQFTEPFKQVFKEWRDEITQHLTLIQRTVDLFDKNHI